MECNGRLAWHCTFLDPSLIHYTTLIRNSLKDTIKTTVKSLLENAEKAVKNGKDYEEVIQKLGKRAILRYYQIGKDFL